MKKYVVIMSLLMFGSMQAMLVPEYCEDDYYCPPYGERINREVLLSHPHNSFWKELSESDDQEQKNEYFCSAIESLGTINAEKRAFIACAVAAGGKLVEAAVCYDGDDKFIKDQLQCKRTLSHICFIRQCVSEDDVELVRFMLESHMIISGVCLSAQSKAMVALLAEYGQVRATLEFLVEEDNYDRVEQLLKHDVSIAEYSELALQAQSADMADLLLLSLRYDDFNQVECQAQINKEHRAQRAYEICKLKDHYRTLRLLTEKS